MGLTITAGPAIEPIARADAQIYVEYPDTDRDDLLDQVITAARLEVEARTRRQLITATYAWTLDSFPGLSGTLYIPRPPYQSTTTLAFVDTAGAADTLIENTDFVIGTPETNSGKSRMCPAYGLVWPSTYTEPDSVTVTFKSGYGDAAASVPAALRLAMSMLISADFDWRPGVVEFKTDGMDERLMRILTPYIVPEFG